MEEEAVADESVAESVAGLIGDRMGSFQHCMERARSHGAESTSNWLSSFQHGTCIE